MKKLQDQVHENFNTNQRSNLDINNKLKKFAEVQKQLDFLDIDKPSRNEFMAEVEKLQRDRVHRDQFETFKEMITTKLIASDKTFNAVGGQIGEIKNAVNQLH